MSKYVWKFDVVNRPSKEKDGITNAFQDFTLKGTVAGDVIPVGSITKSRGNASYVALNLEGDRVGVFDTRSKAAHALRKFRVGKLAAAVTETTETVTETTETDAGGDGPVEAVEAARTVALDEAPAVLGITLGEMMGKIQSGEIKTTENDDGAKLVIIEEDLGGEAA